MVAQQQPGLFTGARTLDVVASPCCPRELACQPYEQPCVLRNVLMPIEIVFETHSTTEDNEAGRATGWLPGRLSARGREQAAELGRRRAADGLAAVFSFA